MINFLCNIPVRIGLLIQFVANLFLKTGFALHMACGTTSGKKLKKLNDVLTALEKGNNQQQEVNDPSAKLAKIIKG